MVPKRYFPNTFGKLSPKDKSLDVELKEPTQWKEHIFKIMTDIASSQPPSQDDCDGGLYVGCSGVGYMFYHVIMSHVLESKKQDMLKQGLKYMTVALSYADFHKQDSRTRAAFLLGNPGVYAVSAGLYNIAGIDDSVDKCVAEYLSCATHLKKVAPNTDELFVGRAGYLAGALWLNKALGREVVPSAVTSEMCELIVESGRGYAKHNRSPCPLMYAYHGTEYLGAAHGLSSILQMVLSCPSYLERNPAAVRDLRATVDFVLGLQQDGGRVPCAMDEVKGSRRRDSDELVHWCHGAPGLVYLMAKAYKVWGDAKYLESCVKCGETVWDKGLLKKGPGICHGVAGNGYVFLLLHRLTHDTKHLDRAYKFASFLFCPEFKQARTPDCPYSLYEGLAGTVCFLADLLTPETAAFPFQDVF